MSKGRFEVSSAQCCRIVVTFEANQPNGFIRGNRSLIRSFGGFFLCVLAGYLVVQTAGYLSSAYWNVTWVGQSVVVLLASLVSAGVFSGLLFFYDLSKCSLCEGPNSHTWHSAICHDCWRDYELQLALSLADTAIKEFFSAKERGEPAKTIDGRHVRAMDALRGAGQV